MRFETLLKLATGLSSLAPDSSIILFGSCFAFATFPDLADDVSMFENTHDADFVPEPWTAELAALLNSEWGEDSAFSVQNGYFADINRPVIYENFPPGFRERLVPLPGCPKVFALEPHDMAIAKIFAGRNKDIAMLSILLSHGKLDEATLRTRLWFMPMDDKLLVKTHHTLRDVVAAARELGYAAECSETPWKTETP